MHQGVFQGFSDRGSIISRLSLPDREHTKFANTGVTEILPWLGTFNGIYIKSAIIIADVIIAVDNLVFGYLHLPGITGYSFINRSPYHIPGFLLHFCKIFLRLVGAYYTGMLATYVSYQLEHPLLVPSSRAAGSDRVLADIDNESVPGTAIKPGLGDINTKIVHTALDTTKVGDIARLPAHIFQHLHNNPPSASVPTNSYLSRFFSVESIPPKIY